MNDLYVQCHEKEIFASDDLATALRVQEFPLPIVASFIMEQNIHLPYALVMAIHQGYGNAIDGLAQKVLQLLENKYKITTTLEKADTSTLKRPLLYTVKRTVNRQIKRACKEYAQLYQHAN